MPSEHGSWVFLLSPLLIGIFAGVSHGGRLSAATLALVVAVIGAFLIRQPVTMATKAYSGRRPRADLPAARFWVLAYGVPALLATAALVAVGYGYVLVLALPGAPVFAWHLYLVSRRAERRQVGVELVASGVLALAAPAAYWVGRGAIDPMGWWLWALTWFQSAASIVYAYVRLEQRERGLASRAAASRAAASPPVMPPLSERLRLGARALAYSTFNLLATLVLSALSVLPALLPLPYAVQWLETVWGTLRPAAGMKPSAIGVRQLIVSTVFTVLFILVW